MIFGRLSLRGVCWIVAIVSVLGGAENFTRHRDDRAFLNHGRHVQAQPVRVEQVTHSRYGKTTRVEYYADMSFQPESGEPVTVTHMPVPNQLVQAMSSGLKADLEYLPERPTKARFSGWTPADGSDTGLAILAFLAAAAGLWFLPKKN